MFIHIHTQTQTHTYKKTCEHRYKVCLKNIILSFYIYERINCLGQWRNSLVRNIHQKNSYIYPYIAYIFLDTLRSRLHGSTSAV